MDQLTYFDGSFHEGNPKIMGPLDQSFWFATQVFDGARAFDGVLPDIERHCKRCVASARTMDMNPEQTADELQELAVDMARKFPRDKQLYVRPTFWSGQTESLWTASNNTFFMMVLEVAPMSVGKAFTACLSDIRRPAPDMAPTLAKASCLYPATSMAVRHAVRAGFDNAVMLDHEGNVAEFATSNLFFARDGQVHTPVPNGTFLNGITRQRVIALLRAAGCDVIERTISYDEVADADEVFNTGNYNKLQPATRIGDRSLQPGPFFKKARDLYFEYVMDEGRRF